MNAKTETKIVHNLAPIAEGEDLHKLQQRLRGWRYGEPGIVQIWVAKGQFAPEAFFAETLGLKDKAAYLEHRTLLKEHLNRFAEGQRELAKAYRQPGGNGTAQSEHSTIAHFISLLIEVRRAGKLWSAAQARAGKEAEAAIAAE